MLEGVRIPILLLTIIDLPLESHPHMTPRRADTIIIYGRAAQTPLSGIVFPKTLAQPSLIVLI